MTLTRRQSLATLAALPWAARAADAPFPTRPVSLIVPFGPGGVADITARTVAQAMTGSLGQPVIVDNRPSAGGIVATQAALAAPHDGHTLLLISNATAVSVHLMRKLPYDVNKALLPISTLGFFDLALVTGTASRFKTATEFIAAAKAQPGKLTLATIAPGSTQHLAAVLLKQRAGIDVLIVPYKGTPNVVTALRSGEVDAAIDVLSPLLPQIQGKALRALALTGESRFALLPEVPTAREAGVPDYVVRSWNALAAPAGTPPAAIARLQRAAAEAIAQRTVRDPLRQLGITAQASTPAEAQALLVREIAHWGEVVRAAHIEPT